MIESFMKNQDIIKETTVYVFKKHIDKYIENFGTFQSVLDSNDNLRRTNEDLKNRLTRYENNYLIKMINKLYSFYKKLK